MANASNNLSLLAIGTLMIFLITYFPFISMTIPQLKGFINHELHEGVTIMRSAITVLAIALLGAMLANSFRFAEADTTSGEEQFRDYCASILYIDPMCWVLH